MNGKEFINHEKWDIEKHQELSNRLSKLEYLIDDDPATNHKGMASKVDELYTVLVQKNGVMKFIAKLIAAIGILYGLLTQMFNHLKIK